MKEKMNPTDGVVFKGAFAPIWGGIFTRYSRLSQSGAAWIEQNFEGILKRCWCVR